MHQVFENSDAEGVILVDATNAFNCLNCHNALINIKNLSPVLSKVLINTYRQHILLFVDGESILSQEGVTQGHLLAMAMYAVTITPLIYRLTEEKLKQVWFADDASAAGKLAGLKSWWNNMTRIGPEHGNFPNSSKTWLIVKEEHLGEAKQLFHETGVKISHGGKSPLRSAIGSRPFVESFVEEKVSK